MDLFNKPIRAERDFYSSRLFSFAIRRVIERLFHCKCLHVYAKPKHRRTCITCNVLSECSFKSPLPLYDS